MPALQCRLSVARRAPAAGHEGRRATRCSVAAAGAPLDLVAFTFIADDLVYPDGTTHMAQVGGGGPQTLFGYQLYQTQPVAVGLAAGVGADLPLPCRDWLGRCGVALDGLLLQPDCPTPRAWQVLEDDGRRAEVRCVATAAAAAALLPAPACWLVSNTKRMLLAGMLLCPPEAPNRDPSTPQLSAPAPLPGSADLAHTAGAPGAGGHAAPAPLRAATRLPSCQGLPRRSQPNRPLARPPSGAGGGSWPDRCAVGSGAEHGCLLRLQAGAPCQPACCLALACAPSACANAFCALLPCV